MVRKLSGLVAKLFRRSHTIWLVAFAFSLSVVAVSIFIAFVLGTLFRLDAATTARWYGPVFVSLSLCVGGFVAYRKLETFRDFEPHLTVSHRLSHRPMGPGYRALTVTADLRNDSKVSTSIQSGYFRICWLAPHSTENIETIIDNSRNDQNDNDVSTMIGDLNLGVISYLDLPRERYIIIEPGEIHSETYNFPLRDDVLESVFIETYFENPSWSSEGSSAKFWGARSPYDFKDTSP